MVDPRLRRNQLQMLLKKRTFISDNELYEMMRSRQVYQIQTELRKELDMRILALKHAQKLRMAGIKNQEAIFRKRADKHEKSKQRITDVKAKMDAILRQSGTTETEEGKYLEKDKLPDIDSHNKSHQQPQNSVTDSNNGCDLESPQTTMEKSGHSLSPIMDKTKEETWTLPSVNTEWMDKNKENPKGNLSVVSVGNDVQDKKYISSSGVSVKNEKHTDKLQSQKIPKKKEMTNTDHDAENAVVSTDEQKSLASKDSKTSYDNVDETSAGANCLNPNETAVSDHKSILRAKTLPTLEVSRKGQRQKRGAYEADDLSTKSYSSQANEPTLPPFNFANNPDQESVRPSQPGVDTDSKQQSLDLQPEGSVNKNTPAQKKTSPVLNDRDITLSDRDLRDKKRVNPARSKSKMPYFKRHDKIYSSEAKEEVNNDADNVKTTHSLPGDLERTVTMLFIEESTSEDDAPKSQFDFEAWLAYNRRKRGYSIVMDEKTFIETNKDNDKSDSSNDKKASKNQVRFNFSRRLAKRDPPPKTFREKSREWYLNFLEAKRKQGQRLTQKQKGFLKGIHGHTTYKLGYTVLPRIGVSLSDPNPGDKKNDHGHIFIVRESTDQKLQRLKDQSKFLQDRVQNFVYS